MFDSDERLANNIRHLQSISDWINNEFFNNKILFAVKLGSKADEYKKPVTEIINGKVGFVISVHFETNEEKIRYAKTIFRQMLIIYMIIEVPDWEVKLNDSNYRKHNYNVFPYTGNGRYLNSSFKNKAMLLGCTVHRDKYGCAIDKLPDKLQKYLEDIEFNDYNFYIPLAKKRRNKPLKSGGDQSIKYYCPYCKKILRGTKEDKYPLYHFHNGEYIEFIIDYQSGRYKQND